MVTYKNIRIPMKNEKTRLQRVKVLASGKYKFVKNLATASKKKKTPKTTRSGKTTARNAKKILGNLGATGLLEDAAIGFFGTSVLMGMGYPMESAMPMTRIVQGVAGKALNRRGKGRLAYGIIDLVDVYLIKQGIRLPQTLSLEAWR